MPFTGRHFIVVFCCLVRVELDSVSTPAAAVVYSNDLTAKCSPSMTAASEEALSSDQQSGATPLPNYT